jgi:hypothetical protein
MENLNIERVIFTYTDSSGSFDNIPKRGTLFTFKDQEYIVRNAYPVTRYTDNGKTPFEVKMEASVVYRKRGK